MFIIYLSYSLLKNLKATVVASLVAHGKESACNAGDSGLIYGLGRSPGEGNGNPLQSSCLENPRDRGVWWVAVHGFTKSWRTVTLHFTCYIVSFIPIYIIMHLLRIKGILYKNNTIMITRKFNVNSVLSSNMQSIFKFHVLSLKEQISI